VVYVVLEVHLNYIERMWACVFVVERWCRVRRLVLSPFIPRSFPVDYLALLIDLTSLVFGTFMRLRYDPSIFYNSGLQAELLGEDRVGFSFGRGVEHLGVNDNGPTDPGYHWVRVPQPHQALHNNRKYAPSPMLSLHAM